MAIVYAPSYPFRQTGPPQYFFGGFDLDRLVIPYRGERPLLDAFLSGTVATPWVPSEYDPAMFLSGYSVGTDRVAPEVQLQYLGKKGGILTAGKHENDDAVLSTTSSSQGFTLAPILGSPLTVEYYAPRRSLTWISKKEGDLGNLEDVTDPGGSITGLKTLVWTVSLNSQGTGYRIGDVLFGTGPSTNGGFRVRVTQVGLVGPGEIQACEILNVYAPLPGFSPLNPISASGSSTGSGASFNLLQIYQVPVTGLGVRIINVIWGALELTNFGSSFLQTVLSQYFHPAIVLTSKSEEVVAGQYWRNTRTKTRVLQPGSIIFEQPPGGIQV